MALTSPRFRPTNTKGLNTSIEYAQALLNNSVSFIVDELPYLKVLLVEHPGKFLMVKAQCNTNGFGFMFQKGHELVPLVSKGILNLRTSDKLIDMEKRWFENQLPYTADDTLNPITLFRFRGLFMITGVSFAFALLVLLILWLRDTWEDLMSSVNIFLSQRLVNFRILFARTIHPNPLADAAIGENAVQMAQQTKQTLKSLSLPVPNINSHRSKLCYPIVLCLFWSESFWFETEKSKFSFFGWIKDYHDPKSKFSFFGWINDYHESSQFIKKTTLRNRSRQYHSPGSDKLCDYPGP
ncbi:hypothetical protein YC2023_105175 [Brassica napus]